MDPVKIEPTPPPEPSIEPQVSATDAASPAPSVKEKSGATTRSKRKPDELTPLEIKQRAANVVIHPRLKPTPFFHENFDALPAKTLELPVKNSNFFYFDDLPLNKRGFKYKPCRPNYMLPSNLYLTCDYPPYKARVSYFDRSAGIACSEAMDAITTASGWLSARSNVGIREGKWYFEYNIVSANDESKSHVRVGLARKEASLEAPVGFDGYGYGLRDLNGQKVHLSRPRPYMSGDDGFKTGDVLGFLVDLPSVEDQKRHNSEFANTLHENHKKKRKTSVLPADDEEKKLNMHNNIVRDQIPIKYKNALYYEQYEYTPTKQMDHLLNPVTVFGEKAILESESKQPTLPTIPQSRIEVFRNGQSCGTMFEDLFSFLPLNVDSDAAASDANTKQQQNSAYRNTDDGTLGYFPMMSSFLKGVVEFNPGPHFHHPIPENARPLCERYDERVVEEWFWDLVDEVEAEYLDSFD